MSHPNLPHLWKLFSGHAKGTLDAAEHAELEQALQSDPRNRALWFLFQDLEIGLRSQIHAPLASPPPSSLWRQRRPLAAAIAAGIALGALSTSALFATIGPLTTRVTQLLRESFETGPAPLRSGMPLHPGVWGGDHTEISGPADGIPPASGRKMLRFLSAQYEGGLQKTGYNSDLHRVFDLREHAQTVAEGKAWICVEACFHSSASAEPGRYLCGIELRALSELPEQGGENAMWHRIFTEQRAASNDVGVPQNVSRREALLPPGAPQWTRLRNDLQIPKGTRFVLVTLHAMDAKSAARKAPQEDVQFPGHFLDDIQVSLSLGRPLP
ncbi:MAG: hypothetical protein RLZZ142_2001 [Verrucomicrobiota bacterium]|jgi:hypothetical protein